MIALTVCLIVVVAASFGLGFIAGSKAAFKAGWGQGYMLGYHKGVADMASLETGQSEV